MTETGTSGGKSVPGASREIGGSKENSPTVKQRFYFDSDIMVLKNNLDYQRLLQTLAVLESQKIQAIKDLESLVQSQSRAEKDPISFVEALRSKSLPPLPTRQVVAEIPVIEWKGYIDSLQQVAKQHSSLYINTRRHSRPLISSLDEKPPASAEPHKDRSATYRQPWTVEEQAQFEELLKVYPPERVERQRYHKIAKALGTRTTQQVATHVQKYFIKLAQSGLPVPGRVPNISRHTRRRKKGRGKRGGLRRPSTFFTSLTPRVFMTEPTAVQQDEQDSSSSEESECFELMEIDESVAGEEGRPTVKCSSCEQELHCGLFWQCSDCPTDTPTHLCSLCVNSDYRSSTHLPSHDLTMLNVPTARNALFDKDYSSFSSSSGYNYLDPNFQPPS